MAEANSSFGNLMPALGRFLLVATLTVGAGDGDQLNTESEWSDGVKANRGYDYRLLPPNG